MPEAVLVQDSPAPTHVQADGRELKEGEEVTLMDWGNAFVRSVSKDGSGAVTGATMELNPGGDPKKTRLKLTWLAQVWIISFVCWCSHSCRCSRSRPRPSSADSC